MQVKTIKIAHPSGFSIINESDFDPSIHRLFLEEPVKEEKKIEHRNPRRMSRSANAEKKTTLPLSGTGKLKR